MSAIPLHISHIVVTCPDNHPMTPLSNGAYHCPTCDARCGRCHGRLVASAAFHGWKCERCKSLDQRRRTARFGDTEG
jgi:hypothetical protein